MGIYKYMRKDRFYGLTISDIEYMHKIYVEEFEDFIITSYLDDYVYDNLADALEGEGAKDLEELRRRYKVFICDESRITIIY